MYAVIEQGGKQYRVAAGDKFRVEKIHAEDGAQVEFDKVILLGKDEGAVVGAPYVDGATVTASVVKNGKEKKIIVYKYKSKKGYHKKQGHRQPYTKLEIQKING